MKITIDGVTTDVAEGATIDFKKASISNRSSVERAKNRRVDPEACPPCSATASSRSWARPSWR